MNRELIQYYGMLILGIITLFGGVFLRLVHGKTQQNHLKPNFNSS